MGIMESMALMPVWSGTETLFLWMMPGAGDSIAAYSFASMGPLASMGWPSASTTRPISALPTGTETTLPVRLTTSPSRMPSSLPNMTMETEFSSRFCAMPYEPLENSTSSPAIQLSSPAARAMPSPIRMTVPVSDWLIFVS